MDIVFLQSSWDELVTLLCEVTLNLEKYFELKYDLQQSQLNISIRYLQLVENEAFWKAISDFRRSKTSKSQMFELEIRFEGYRISCPSPSSDGCGSGS